MDKLTKSPVFLSVASALTIAVITTGLNIFISQKTQPLEMKNIELQINSKIDLIAKDIKSINDKLDELSGFKGLTDATILKLEKDVIKLKVYLEIE